MVKGCAAMIPKKESGYNYFFRQFVRPHASTIIFLFALNFVGMIFSLISPLLTKSLIDDVFIGKRIELFGYILLGITGIYTISALSNYISGYTRGKFDLVLFKNVTGETFNVIQLASLRRTQEMKVGDLLSRIMYNVRSAINIFTSILPGIVMSITRIVAPFVIMLSLNLKLTLIVMTPTFLFFLSSSFFGKRLRHKQRASLDRTASVHSFLKETLSIIPLIKVFGLEIWSRDKFNEQINDYYDASIDATKTSSLSSSVGSLVYGVPMILLFYFGGVMVVQGSLSLGTFTAFMSYVTLFFTPISQLSYYWTSYKSSSAAFDRVNELFELEQDDLGDEKLIVKDGVIEFDNVWFSYNNRYILEGFNTTFKRGLNYIIGDNGTGKSTILKLLCSLYPLERGYITIDGQDISKVRIVDLRKYISMVFSEPYLFDSSIYENICIGNLLASEDEVINAAKLTRVHELITSLPQGYKTKIGEDGLKLSSGEKQKIALARAILKNTPIILLDEVTKSIDAESTKSINGTIKSLKNEKTIIIVTHNTNEIEDESNIIYLGQESYGMEHAQYPMGYDIPSNIKQTLPQTN